MSRFSEEKDLKHATIGLEKTTDPSLLALQGALSLSDSTKSIQTLP